MSVYKFIEVVGTSPDSWEDAARNAVMTTAQTVRDIRVAEIKELDMHVEDNIVVAYRARVSISFKVEKDII